MSIELHFDPRDWERLERDWCAWWAGELERPLVMIEGRVPRSGDGSPELTPEKRFTSEFPLEMPVDEVQSVVGRQVGVSLYDDEVYIRGGRFNEAVFVVDGVVVPDEPGIVFARGEQHDVPFIGGGNSYEGSVMTGSGFTPREYLASWGDRVGRLRALYADDFEKGTPLGASRLFGDRRYLLSGRVLATYMSRVSSPGYLYYFSFVPSELSLLPPLVAMFAVLSVKPTGLFGTARVERV